MTGKELNSLVKRLQDGEMQYFDDIYYETKSIVYYTILAIVKDHSLSEDLMQETYLKALEKIHSFKPRYSFKSWIVVIARNLALNEYNRRKRELSFDPSVDEYIFGSQESLSEKQMIVKELVEKLNPVEREIVLLHIIGDMKHREIAQIVGKPLGTVTWMYNEAIKKLRNEYGE